MPRERGCPRSRRRAELGQVACQGPMLGSETWAWDCEGTAEVSPQGSSVEWFFRDSCRLSPLTKPDATDKLPTYL